MDEEEDEVTENGIFETTTPQSDATSSPYPISFTDHRPWIRILNFLIHTPKGLALLLSVVIFLIIVMLGVCICFCVKFLRRKNEGMPRGNAVHSTSSTFLPQPPPSDLTDLSGTGKKSSTPRIEYKNIITPERSIAFVVPTIPTQIQGKCRQLYPCHVTSTTQSTRQRSISGGQIGMTIPPLLETQFFPQFQYEETMGPQIGFTLAFDPVRQNLQLRVLAGSNFPETGLSYAVHMKLYPGRGSKEKTSECRGSNPVYNYEANFHVRGSVLQTKVLKLRVIGCSAGVIGTKSLLGVVNLAMKDIPVVNHNDVTSDFRTGVLWIGLDHPLQVGEGVRLFVSLKWSNDPAPGLLVLKIREAQGLHEIAEADYTSTYVKVTLQEQGKSIKSRKTRLIRWGSLPDYDDTFVVTVPQQLLTQVSFLLTLIARGRLGSKTILGRLAIGSFPESHPSSPQSKSGLKSGCEIWEDILHQPNVEISKWLQLLP